MAINKLIGNNIRAIRQLYGWTQLDIAHRLGITTPAISKIESGGTDLNFSRLEQIAHIFKISVIQILVFNTEMSLKTPHLKVVQKLNMREVEIVQLQRQVIHLTEELRTQK